MLDSLYTVILFTPALFHTKEENTSFGGIKGTGYIFFIIHAALYSKREVSIPHIPTQEIDSDRNFWDK